MRLDPEFVAEMRAWLVKAANDLRAAELMSSVKPPLAGDALLHCQQAAEKRLKGFLTWHGRIFGKTHNIAHLGLQALELARDLDAMLGECAHLSDYARRFRCPGEPAEPAPDEPEEALALARRLNEAVLAMLPREVQP